MVELAKKWTASKPFCVVVTTCILLNAALLGVETSQTVMAAAGTYLNVFNYIFKAIFLVEIILRLIAFHPNYRRFFKDGWNVFDFVIVAITTVPLGGDYANVGRVLRLLRVIRLVTVSDELKLIVSTMFRSIPSMGHVILLLSMLLYVYGVAGDVVTRQGPDFFINGKHVALAKHKSRRGEPLAAGPIGVIPHGCYFAGTPHKDGFDSRYAIIGWICRDRIVGTGSPVL